MKQFNIVPAEQRVVILPIEAKEKKTASGIILTPNVQEDKPGMGTIIAVGNGSKEYPMNYNIGDKVIYSQYAGLNVSINLSHGDAVYKVMNQMDIMGTIYEMS